MNVKAQPRRRRAAHYPFPCRFIHSEQVKKCVNFCDRTADMLATAREEPIAAELQQCRGEYGQRLS